MEQHITTSNSQRTLFGQPIGLFILFFTEMWERFSYYGMRAILVLYLVEKTMGANPGLGWSTGDALMLYGWYTMLVYVACIPGGLIADNLLGQKKTVMWGAILLVIGHSILAVQAMWAFYTGLGFIVIGVGMLKANISTMVGGLYKRGDIRRDKGFTIFYIGINIGALLSAISVGYVGEKIGWHYGFGMAGIAMALGLVVYLWGQKYLTHVGDLKKDIPEDEQGVKEPTIGELYLDLLKSPLQLSITTILLLFSLYWVFFNSLSNGLLFVFLTAVVALMMMIYKDLGSRVVKDRYLVIILSFLLTIVFWGAFEQAGGLMSIYAKDKIDRFIPSGFPLLGGMEVPATWFQSLNSAYIIIFGVIVANFWARRKLKNKEASSLFKMAVGTMIMGLGFLFMAGAAAQYSPGDSKAAMYWLFLAYLFHTIGELSSSPVALSFVTKLSPVKYASLMMGLYFAATGFGNKLAGFIGSSSQSEPIRIELNVDKGSLASFMNDEDRTAIANNKDFALHSLVYPQGNEFEAIDAESGRSLLPLIKFDDPERIKEITSLLNEKEVTKTAPFHANFEFRKLEGVDAASVNAGYSGSFIIQEIQTRSEYKTFIGIVVFTFLFGLLVILILKPLKRLTHGVEDDEQEIMEQEKYELGQSPKE